jgi:hypothetical protein
MRRIMPHQYRTMSDQWPSQRRVQELTAILKDLDDTIAARREELRLLKQHRVTTEAELVDAKAAARSDGDIQGILVRRDLGMSVKEIARAMRRSKTWVEKRLREYWKAHGKLPGRQRTARRRRVPDQ